MPETHSEARNKRIGGGLEERFQSSVASTRYEYVDVFFETAGVDVVVAHSLLPLYPDQVNYEVVQATTPVQIYHDGTASRRKWKQTEIYLRSNVSTVWVRLRVSLPADDANQRQGSVNAVDPGATFFPEDVAVAGALAVLGALDVAGAADFNSTGDFLGVLTTQSGINLTGGAIAFPAVQVPSAGVNTLDDYEEAPWTPALRFGGGTTGLTYSEQIGRFTKIGNVVVATFRIALSAKGSSTGSATLAGLVDAALSTTPQISYSGTPIGAAMAALTSPITMRVTGNTSVIDLFDWGATGVTALDETNFGNTSVLSGTLVYRTA